MAKRKRANNTASADLHATSTEPLKIAKMVPTLDIETDHEESVSLPDIEFDSEEEVSEVSDTVSDSDDDMEMETDLVDDMMEKEHVHREEAQRKVSQLYKAPTADEMHELKDTEELFKSNLFKWQIDELLKEVSVKQEKCAGLEKMLWRLKSILDQMVDQPEADLAHVISHLKKSHRIEIPFPNPQPHPDEVRYTFGFKKPSSVRVVGSFLLKTMIKNRTDGLNVDMAVEMPSSLFQDKDFMNYRYFYKRAYYLTTLAAELQRHSKDLGITLSFSLLNNDHRKPILVLKSTGNGSDVDFSKSKCVIRILPCVAEDVFLPARLAPQRNAIRPKDQATEDQAPTPTPQYNASVLLDTQYVQHLNYLHRWLRESDEKAHGAFRDAIQLMKIWLQRRGMDVASQNGINGFLISMMMAWLFTAGGPRGTRKLSTNWSSYQLLRVTWDWLANHDVQAEPIMMNNPEDGSFEEGFRPADFQARYDVVVVDPSGHVNLAADVTRGEWDLLRREARMASHMLASSGEDHFDALFLVNLSEPLLRHDNSCVVPQCPKVVPLISKGKRLDFGASPRAIVYAAEALLQKALASRFKGLLVSCPAIPSWEITSLRSDHESKSGSAWTTLTIHMLLDPERARRLVDHGPSAEDKSACEQFRLIWGDKAELRRFKDGAISESVVWAVDPLLGADGRLTVVEQAVKYLLKKHLRLQSKQLKQITFIGNQYLPMLLPSKSLVAKPTTSFQPVMVAFESLSKSLRALSEHLPLSISDVRPAHPALRHATVIVPQPLDGHTAFHEPMDVVVTLESSGKWPSDLRAIQITKGAFYLQIAEHIEKTLPGTLALVRKGELRHWDPNGLSADAAGFVDVVTPTGFIFRCRLHHGFELTLLEREMSQKDVTPIVKEQAQAATALYEYYFVQLPMFTQFILALSHQHTAYSGTVRLFKRWLASHWMLSAGQSYDTIPLAFHFPDEIVELLCAHVFANSPCYGDFVSPLTGFIRVLRLLVQWDWKNMALIVELQEGAAQPELINDIQNEFKSLRQQDPDGRHSAMYVVPLTKPASKNEEESSRMQTLWRNSRWSKMLPSRMVLQRAQKLAMTTLKHLQEAFHDLGMETGDGNAETIFRQRFNAIFNHDISDYDVVIHLDEKKCSRRFENSDYREKQSSSGSSAESEQFKNLQKATPNQVYCMEEVVDATLDYAACFISELQNALGDSTLLFHDRYGGKDIGLVFNPNVFKTPRPFKVNCEFNYYTMPTDGSEESSSNKKSRNKSFVVGNIDAVLETIDFLGRGFIKSIDIAESLKKYTSI